LGAEDAKIEKDADPGPQRRVRLSEQWVATVPNSLDPNLILGRRNLERTH